MSEELKYTQADVDALLQQEGDRRVTSAQTKWNEKLPDLIQAERVKWEEESKLTAEQLAQKQVELKLKELEDKEKSIKLNENMLNAKTKLIEAGIPTDEYTKMINVLVTSDEENTKSNVENFISVYSSTKSALENSIREELSKVPPPQQHVHGSEITKQDFMKMSYGEKLQFKTNHPELYSEFIK